MVDDTTGIVVSPLFSFALLGAALDCDSTGAMEDDATGIGVLFGLLFAAAAWAGRFRNTSSDDLITSDETMPGGGPSSDFTDGRGAFGFVLVAFVLVGTGAARAAVGTIALGDGAFILPA